MYLAPSGIRFLFPPQQLHLQKVDMQLKITFLFWTDFIIVVLFF